MASIPTQPTAPPTAAIHVDKSLLLCRPSAHGAFPLGDILASRAPTAWAAAQWAAALSPDRTTQAALTQTIAAGRPTFVLSPAGVGRLIPTYAAAAGIWVYAHVHIPPRVVQRLIADGLFATDDTPTVISPHVIPGTPLPVVRGSEAVLRREVVRWSAWLARWDEPLLHVDAAKRLPDPLRVISIVERLAHDIECRVLCRECPSQPTSCYLPHLLEVTLLALLCIARDHTPERTVSYALTSSAAPDGERLVLRAEMACLCPSDDAWSATVRPALEHLRRVTESQEGIFLATRSEPHPYDRTVHPLPVVRDLIVTVTYPRDPHREPWGDFKHPGRTLR